MSPSGQVGSFQTTTPTIEASPEFEGWRRG